MKGFSAHPETIWDETLDVVVAESDKAARRLRRAGVGATVRLTNHAIEQRLPIRARQGVIVGWGNHRWVVKVRPRGRKTVSSYHVRFWAPVTPLRGSRSRER